jgi:hypothetical protein
MPVDLIFVDLISPLDWYRWTIVPETIDPIMWHASPGNHAASLLGPIWGVRPGNDRLIEKAVLDVKGGTTLERTNQISLNVDRALNQRRSLYG